MENACAVMSEFKRQYIHKVATRKCGTEHSAEVTAELVEYRNRKGFLRKGFRIEICLCD